METGAQLNEGCNSSFYLDLAEGRLVHASDNFQQCALARAIPPYQPYHLPFRYFERDILYCIKVVVTRLGAEKLSEDFPQCIRPLVNHAVALGDVLQLYRREIVD